MQALYCAGMVITAPFPLVVIAAAVRTQTSRFGVDIYPAPNMPIGALPTLPAGFVSIRLSVRILGWFLTDTGAFPMEGIPGGFGTFEPKFIFSPASCEYVRGEDSHDVRHGCRSCAWLHLGCCLRSASRCCSCARRRQRHAPIRGHRDAR